ncbi:MAG: hypothetical protein ACFFEA_12110, partial [Candidatus Thorarchaeota archaeon]
MMQPFSDPNLNALFIIIVVGGSIACGTISVIRRRRDDGSSPIVDSSERFEDTSSITAILSQTSSDGAK